MKTTLGLGLLFVSINVLAQTVSNPYTSLCQYSFHSDSYGRGIESAFTEEDLRSAYHDESCYQLGVSAAEEAIRNEGRARCKQRFLEARPEGLKVSGSSDSVVCAKLGYAAGIAALGTGAREARQDIAPVDCIAAYTKGRADGRSGRNQLPSRSRAEAYCYQLGLFEAPLF
jgi:hypothetical protein